MLSRLNNSAANFLSSVVLNLSHVRYEALVPKQHPGGYEKAAVRRHFRSEYAEGIMR